MKKTIIPTIHEKNRIIDNIIEAMTTRKKFLILGPKKISHPRT
jgi:hypothetical protein